MHQAVENHAAQTDVYQRLGGITRQLHDALNELGHTDRLKDAVEQLPDTQSRLAYISQLTGNAAERVLNHVDAGKVELDLIGERIRQVGSELDRVAPNDAAIDGLRARVADIESANARVDQHLTEIMIAQDFHDLTGQVIGRVLRLASTLEKQLLLLLVESAPSESPGENRPARAPAEALDGPVVNGAGRTDVVKDQAQVDDLLASLGF